MRLQPEQILQTHEILRKYFNDIPYKLYLYGSRTQDHLKGGDIDLLIVTTQAGVDLFNHAELDLLVQIKKQPAIGQRRIDLKAVTQLDLETKTFLRVIADSLMELTK